MANKICYVLNEKLPHIYVEKVKVPDGAKYSAGEAVLCETLDTTNANNIEVYLGSNVATVADDRPCTIINGWIDQMADGRRYSDQPNPGQFDGVTSDMPPVTAIRPAVDLKLFISADCVDGTLAVGSYLIPQATSRQYTVSATDDAKVAYKIEALMNMGIGGMHGLPVAPGAVIRCTKS